MFRTTCIFVAHPLTLKPKSSFFPKTLTPVSYLEEVGVSTPSSPSFSSSLPFYLSIFLCSIIFVCFCLFLGQIKPNSRSKLSDVLQPPPAPPDKCPAADLYVNQKRRRLECHVVRMHGGRFWSSLALSRLFASLQPSRNPLGRCPATDLHIYQK